MCVGLSAKVVDIKEDTAIIDAEGVKKEVNTSLLDELEVGDYIMVHAGTAIAKIGTDTNVLEEVL
ncbi:MAG: HypC/HybG/HupF family hydrogenase formation chaperone [Firmicutes bacterium]|nr:HypC/HybG/HupF family hydrogenase formation chaperone [Bacillota bacterium]